MSLICARMSLVCHPYVTLMYLYVIRMSSLCHWYVLVCHPYVTGMYSYVIGMPLVCDFTMILTWFIFKKQKLFPIKIDTLQNVNPVA